MRSICMFFQILFCVESATAIVVWAVKWSLRRFFFTWRWLVYWLYIRGIFQNTLNVGNYFEPGFGPWIHGSLFRIVLLLFYDEILRLAKRFRSEKKTRPLCLVLRKNWTHLTQRLSSCFLCRKLVSSVLKIRSYVLLWDIKLISEMLLRTFQRRGKANRLFS